MTRTAERAVPIIEFAGGIPVLLPCASDYLPEKHLDALRGIEEAVAKGRKVLAQRLALELEKRLGITMEDRITALKAETEDDALIEGALARAAATAKEPPNAPRRRKKERSIFDPIPALAPVRTEALISLPEGERGRSPEEVRRWERSQQILVNPHLSLSDEQKDVHAGLMADVEAAPRRRAETSAIASHLDSAAARAQAAGQTVERSKRGRVNVLEWDAVKSLAQVGALSAPEVATADHFKGLYEARTADSGAASYGDAKGGGHNHESFIAKRFERAQASELIGRAERAVAVQCSNDPACLQMFRGVLDENKALSSYGKGRAYQRHLASLQRALGVAGEVWANWRKERSARHVAETDAA